MTFIFVFPHPIYPHTHLIMPHAGTSYLVHTWYLVPDTSHLVPGNPTYPAVVCLYSSRSFAYSLYVFTDSYVSLVRMKAGLIYVVDHQRVASTRNSFVRQVSTALQQSYTHAPPVHIYKNRHKDRTYFEGWYDTYGTYHISTTRRRRYSP